MSEQAEHPEQLPPAPAESAEPEVLILIRRLQQQISFLEKKIDLLISQSQARPAQESSFSKPYQSFGPSHHRADRDQEHSPRERSFDRGRHFDKRHNEDNRGFHHKRKPYGHSLGPKKKPFYAGRRPGGR
jgi:hypothetical protein